MSKSKPAPENEEEESANTPSESPTYTRLSNLDLKGAHETDKNSRKHDDKQSKEPPTSKKSKTIHDGSDSSVPKGKMRKSTRDASSDLPSSTTETHIPPYHHKPKLGSKTLRDAFLSSFGDDVVVRQDDNNKEHEEEDAHDILYKQKQVLHFEKIPSEEVMTGFSNPVGGRWRKAIMAGLLTSTSPSHNSEQRNKRPYDDADESPVRNVGPFWGVPPKLRAQISMLSLQLILHEVACFCSCVLLGCLIMNFHTVHPSHHHPPSNKQAEQQGQPISMGGDRAAWLIGRGCDAIVIFLIVVTAIGCLIRMDTTGESSNHMPLTLMVLPAILLTTVSIYLVKAWAFQEEECHDYWNLSEDMKKHAHVTQNCDQYYHFYNNTSKVVTGHSNHSAPMTIMKGIPILGCFIIAIYMFIFRNSNFYLIDQFKPKL